MITIVTRANEQGEFSEVGTTDRWLFQDIQTQQGAIERAIEYANGKAYRVELFHDGQFYNAKPFAVIIQTALQF